MRKRILCLFLTLTICLTFLPTVALAADNNSDGYDDGDVAVILELIENHGLTWDKDPASWPETGVRWSSSEGEKRLVWLSLDEESMPDSTLTGDVSFAGLTELSSLRLSDQDITSLDLSGLSELYWLNCGGNENLSVLDLTGLTNLAYLDCSDTAITELDLSDQTDLQVLACDDTGITALALNNLTELTYLSCDGTGITSLDLSALSNLENLSCSETGVAVLDISKNPLLTSLDCADTAIAALDLRQNAMDYLDVSGTQLTTLDLSQQSVLDYLDVSGTRLTTLDLSGCSVLTSLDCSDAPITTLTLPQQSVLDYLDVSGTRLTTLDLSGCSALTGLFCTNTGLETLTVPAGYTANYSYDGETFALPTPYRENYLFQGWYTDEAAVTRVAEGDTFAVATVLYANYTDVNPFTDLEEGSYYYDAVLETVERGITKGTTPTTFSPDLSGTRAQMVTFLWRLYGSRQVDQDIPFTDVPADAYYADAVKWAVAAEITNGTSETAFSPEQTCTRAQCVTFLWRLCGSPEPTSDSTQFTDLRADAYYTQAVRWAVETGITYGTTATSFEPDLACTRAQMVTFLYRCFLQEG